MERIEIRVIYQDQLTWHGIATLPVEVGRQQEHEDGPPDLQDLVSLRRLVIAPVSVRSMPRQAVRIEDASDKSFRIVNIHPRLSFFIGHDYHAFPPGTQFDASEETCVYLPEQYQIWIRPARNILENRDAIPDVMPSNQFRTVVMAEPASGAQPVGLRELLERSVAADRGRAAVDLVRTALSVVRTAAGSNEFFEAAVRAAAEMVELDRALVLLREGDRWQVRAVYHRDSTTQVEASRHNFSESLLRKLLVTGQTAIFEPGSSINPEGASLMLMDRAVASPIYDQQQNVIGALYGDRRTNFNASEQPIGDLEAALFEVLAGAVSSGLARQRQEAMRASLSQFFSPHVAERLEHKESLLAGRDAIVTVLFCDIRGFSAITERVGPARAIEWINDVLTELSQCVLRYDGVLVDYVGDELMAMWGMPGEQPDHAARACRAACDMMNQIPTLCKRWAEIAPDGFGIGIGICTGPARVGNTGSHIKFKYGPLGNTVNLASRVQGVTKQLGVSALITTSTVQSIGDEFQTRRLVKAKVLGLAEPVELHELYPAHDDAWEHVRSRYEKALAAFESGDSTNAARYLATLLHDHPDDRPSLLLLGRVVDRLANRKSSGEDTIWTLDRK